MKGGLRIVPAYVSASPTSSAHHAHYRRRGVQKENERNRLRANAVARMSKYNDPRGAAEYALESLNITESMGVGDTAALPGM